MKYLIESSVKSLNAQNLIAEAIAAYKRNPVVIQKFLFYLFIRVLLYFYKLDVDETNESLELSQATPANEDKTIEDKKQLPVAPTVQATQPVAPVTTVDPTPNKLAVDKKEKVDTKKRKTLTVDSKPVEIEPEPEPEYIPPGNDLMTRRLGEIALASLNAGEAIKDEIVVHIIIEQIKRIPQDKGWILDGFPLTYNQAKLLEKALNGYDEDKPFPVRPKQESILAPNPKPEPLPPKHVSAIDLVINLEVSNETALKRSGGRYCKV